MASDRKASAEETVDAVEGETVSLNALACYHCSSSQKHSLLISKDIRPLALLSNVHGKVDSLA